MPCRPCCWMCCSCECGAGVADGLCCPQEARGPDFLNGLSGVIGLGCRADTQAALSVRVQTAASLAVQGMSLARVWLLLVLFVWSELFNDIVWVFSEPRLVYLHCYTIEACNVDAGLLPTPLLTSGRPVFIPLPRTSSGSPPAQPRGSNAEHALTLTCCLSCLPLVAAASHKC